MVFSGSGSLAALGVLEREYKDNMEVMETMYFSVKNYVCFSTSGKISGYSSE